LQHRKRIGATAGPDFTAGRNVPVGKGLRMKKTYVTEMPDEVGSFLQASRAIASNGGNITRVSYNRAVDSHLLFIEAEGNRSAIESITGELERIGYLFEPFVDRRPLLISLRLADKPGSILSILEVIDGYHLNISYMSSEADGTGWQDYKLAVVVDDADEAKRLLEELSLLCPTVVSDYDPTQKLLDNTVFYLSFSQDMRNLLELDRNQANEFIVNANKIMQLLDEQGEPPFKTFEYIRKFATTVVGCKGDAFHARVDSKAIGEGVILHLIEPPCGSNIFILEDGGSLIFVDGGFPCYLEETTKLLRSLFKDFDRRSKTLVLTHADVDHVGIAPICSRILANASCRENFALEAAGKSNFREQNRKDAPYVRLSKLITGYDRPIDADKVTVYGRKKSTSLIEHVGMIELAGMEFECYEGSGGHVRGESVYICREKRLAFTGDDLVSIKGFSEEQAAFNQYAPYLMSSVNTDSKKAKAIRLELQDNLKGCLICPGHGHWFRNGE
jgi:glyoxylase-like metal-dependent hydrolase (beta-lactamase superfamily II)/uncharacterized protein with ACT and thioredoxin-like domain